MAPSITLTQGPGARGLGEVVQRTTASGARGISWAGGLSDLATLPARVAARVVSDPHGATVVDWTYLENTKVSRTSWEGSFPGLVPTGSWYNVELRAIRDDGSLLAENLTEPGQWGVGAVVLIAGQSNAVDLVAPGQPAFHSDAGNTSTGVYGPWFQWVRPNLLDGPNALCHGFYLPAAAWTQGTKRITLPGAFAAYVFQAGDKVYLYGGGITPGYYTINSKVSNDVIDLVEDLGPNTVIANVPRNLGFTALTKQLRLAYVAAGKTMPIGLVNGATDSTSLYKFADFLNAGHWLEERRGSLSEPWELCRAALAVATGALRCEIVCWQQGEAEAMLRQVYPADPLKAIDANYYYVGLKHLVERFERDYVSYDGQRPKIVIATVGGNAQTNLTFNFAHLGQYEQVREQQIRFCMDTGRSICALHGVERDPDQLHFTETGQGTFATRLAGAISAQLGYAGHSKTGPYIEKASFGDIFALDAADETSRNHITCYVKHDQGNDLTLPSEPHVSFEVHDQKGPLYVSKVTKGVTVAGVQPLCLTLERNTAQTAGADRPYSAPEYLVGTIAWVRYAGFPTLRGDATINRFIIDNATLAMPLLSTWGVDTPEKHPSFVGTPLWDHKNYEPNVLICMINDVANLAINEITLDNPDGASPDGWTPLSSDTPTQIRPGDRFICEEGAPFNGTYVGEGTLRYVKTYVNESNDVVIEISHDMTGQAPIVGNYLSFYTKSISCGCIVAYGRDSIQVGV